MDKFLARLHKKPDHHKRRFAFMTSATITLLIFGVWSLATYGVGGVNIGGKGEDPILAETTKSEVGPMDSLRESLATGFEALRSSFNELKSSLGPTNFSTRYEEMRDQSLEIYGE